MLPIEDFASAQVERARVYRFIGRLFARPLEREDIEALAQAGDLARGVNDSRMASGLAAMSRYLRFRNTGTYEVLNCDYTSAFYGVQTLEGKVAIPYESAFVDEGQRYMGAARFKVFNILKKNCLKAEQGVDLPEDHLSYLCEFMAVMSERASLAVSQGDGPEAAMTMRLQRAFLRSHIANWFGDLVQVAGAIVQERFYKGAMEFAEAFFSLDDSVMCELLSAIGSRKTPVDIAEWEVVLDVQGEEEALRAVG